MNMADVECFMKVAELMSFSKAADALYISQQAVSNHVKRLERTYNVQLFERRPSLKLTESGKILLDAARDIILREDILSDQLTHSKRDQYGEIAIGLPSNRSFVFASEFIPRFNQLYPNMTVNLLERSSTLLPGAIKQNEIDLALPLVFEKSTIVDPFLFVMLPLEAEDLYLVISDQLLERYFPDSWPENKQSFRAGVYVKDFAHVPMFLRPVSSPLHEEIVSLLAQEGLRPIIRMKTAITSTMLPLCAQGYGILFCPPMLLNYMYHEQPQYFPALNAFIVKDFASKRRTVLLYHKNKYLTQPLRDSIAIIQDIYSQHEQKFRQLPFNQEAAI